MYLTSTWSFVTKLKTVGWEMLHRQSWYVLTHCPFNVPSPSRVRDHMFKGTNTVPRWRSPLWASTRNSSWASAAIRWVWKHLVWTEWFWAYKYLKTERSVGPCRISAAASLVHAAFILQLVSVVFVLNVPPYLAGRWYIEPQTPVIF